MSFHPEETADPSRRREGPDPGPLEDALAAFIDQRAWRGRLEGAQVHGRWDEIAGVQLVRHTEPVRLQGGVLVVRAASAGWATQVRYLAGELAARANAVLGEGQVRQVTVVTGSLRQGGSEPDC